MSADSSPGSRPTDGLVRKLRARDVVSECEADALATTVEVCREFEGGTLLVPAGIPLDRCNLLVDGFVCRFKDLADGQRQILELHVPGDFVDLHSFLLKKLEHNIGALTRVQIAYIPHDRLKCVTEEHPHLSRMLWFSTLLDAAIHREWILSMGRRSAVARIAHMFCELHLRMEVSGLTEDHSYALPLTQIDLADAAGLTHIHVNRMLKQLREEGLMTWRSGRVTIHDWEGLQRVAEFNPGYLYLERQPR